MQETREFNACDKSYGEIYESGRMRAKQTRGGVSCGQHNATLTEAGMHYFYTNKTPPKPNNEYS
jgi:hypothetical protein